MAVITIPTAGQVNPVHVKNSDMVPMKGPQGLLIGQLVYITSTGQIALSDASVAGTAIVDGVIVGVGAGVYDVANKAWLAGYDVSGVDYGDPLFLSDTAGAFDDAAGSVSLTIAKVWPRADFSLTKLVYFNTADQS